MADYKPISCDDHDGLELAVMHATSLKITYHDEAGHTQTETHVRATDVKTRDGAEWLTFICPAAKPESCGSTGL